MSQQKLKHESTKSEKVMICEEKVVICEVKGALKSEKEVLKNI